MLWINYSNTGEKFSVNLEGSTTVGDVKKAIFEDRGIPTENQNISNDSVALTDNDVLEISSESMVNLTVLKPFPKCSNCKKPFIGKETSPIHLDCGHFVCPACYQTAFSLTVTKDVNGDIPVITKFNCPCCNRVTWRREDKQGIGHEKMTELVAWMTSEDENYNELVRACSDVKCFYCKELEAVLTCSDCVHSFCAECDEEVHSMKRYKSHQRGPLIAKYVEKFPMCTEHPNEECKVFCRKDDALICSSCIMETGSHYQHKVITTLQAAAEIKDKIRARITSLTEAENKMAAGTDSVAKRLNKITSESDAAIANIHQCVDELVKILRQREVELVKRVRENQVSRELRCIELRQLFAQVLSYLQVGQESCKQLLLSSNLSLIKGTRWLQLTVPKETIDQLNSSTMPSEPCATVNLTAAAGLKEALGYFGMVGGPDPPLLLPFQEIGPCSALASWKPRGLQVGKYHLELSQVMPTSKVCTGVVYSGPDLRFQLESLKPQSRYSVRVRGECLHGGGLGAWSDALEFSTTEASDEPSNNLMPFTIEDKAPGFSIDSSSPLTITASGSGKWGTMALPNGIELVPNSGSLGYFEVKLIALGAKGQNNPVIGFTNKSAPSSSCLGHSKGVGWNCSGQVASKLPNVTSVSMTSLEFAAGDTVGLLLNCRLKPFLALYLNGKSVYHTVLPEECYKMMLYPGISVFGQAQDAKLEIIESPRMPPDVNLASEINARDNARHRKSNWF